MKQFYKHILYHSPKQTCEMHSQNTRRARLAKKHHYSITPTNKNKVVLLCSLFRDCDPHVREN